MELKEVFNQLTISQEELDDIIANEDGLTASQIAKQSLKHIQIPFSLMNLNYENAFREFEESNPAPYKIGIESTIGNFYHKQTHELLSSNYVAISYLKKTKTLRFFAFIANKNQEFNEKSIDQDVFEKKLNSCLVFLNKHSLTLIKATFHGHTGINLTDKSVKNIELFIFSKTIIGEETRKTIDGFVDHYMQNVVQIPSIDRKNVAIIIKDLNDFKEMIDLSDPKNMKMEFSSPLSMNHISSETGLYCVLGLVKGGDLFNAYDQYKDTLLSGNVRSYLGKQNKVNSAIIETIKENPAEFHIFNNGITIITSSLEKDQNAQIIALNQPHIINGGQTTTSIYLALKDLNEIERSKITEKLYVKAKIIIVPNINDFNLIQEIAIAANDQTPTKTTDIFSSNHILKDFENSAKKLSLPSGKKYYFERVQGSYKLALTIDKKFKNEYSDSVDAGSIVQALWIYLFLPNYAALGKQDATKKLNAFDNDKNINEKLRAVINEELYQDLLAIYLFLEKLKTIISEGKIPNKKLTPASYNTIRLYVCMILIYRGNLDLKEFWNNQDHDIDDEKKAKMIEIAIELIELVEKEQPGKNHADVLKKDILAVIVLKHFITDRSMISNDHVRAIYSYFLDKGLVNTVIEASEESEESEVSEESEESEVSKSS